MKLLKYELYKIWHHPLTFGFLTAFLVINLTVFIWQTRDKQGQLLTGKEEYEQLEAEYSQIPMKDAYEELSQRSSFLQKAESVEVALQNNDTAMIENIMASDPDFPHQYQQMEQMGGIPSPERRSAIYLLAAQAEYMRNYPDYIDSIRQKANQMSQVSIFSQPDTFSYRNIQKTPADFEACKDIPLSFGQSAGLVAFSDFYLTDFLVLFLILQIAVRLFWDEKEKGLLILVKSTVNGRMRQAITKLATLLLMGICVSLAFYGLNILTAGFLFGFGDPSRYIQSMREFGGGNILLSVREYIGVFLLGKIFLCCLFAMAFSLAFSFFHNNTIALLTIFVSTGGLFFAYQVIPPLSPLNVLKYLNPVAALNLRNVLSQYNNLNLFGFPCNRIMGLIITGILMELGLGFLLIRLFVSQERNRHAIKSLETAKYKIQAFLAKGFRVHLVGLEFRKVLCTRKIILVPIALAILCSGSIQREESICSFNDTVYKNYMQLLEGELTSEKQDFLLSERSRFDHIGEDRKQLQTQLENGTITRNEYQYEIFLLDGFSKKQDGFERVWEQYQYLLPLQQQKEHTGFISALSVDYIFSQSARDAVTGILWIVLIVSVTAVTFCQEYKKDIIAILSPTYHGKGKLFAAKILVAILLAVSFAGIYVPIYVNACCYYPLGDLSVSVRSIQKFSAIPGSVSILELIIFTHISQMLTAISVVLVTAFISVKIQNQVAAMIAGSALLTIPLILFLCGVSFAGYIPFANPYVLFAAMKSPYGMTVAMISMAAALAAGLFLSRQAYMIFCNQRRKRHGA